MHVKLVVSSFPAASQTFLFNLVTGLEKKGVEVSVCASKKSKDLHLYAHRLNEWSGNIDYVSHQPYSLQKIVQAVFFAMADVPLLMNCIKKRGLKKGCLQFMTLGYFLKGKPDIIHFAFSGNGLHQLKYLDHLKKNLLNW